jgi:ATP-dependent RNA helicase DDX5/DBP2
MLKRVLVIPRLFNSGFKKPEESDFVKSFEQLGLPEKVLNHLKEFTAPSEIQSKSMKSLMQGQDMIAIAPTGSGKTLAFAIPALVKSAELHKNRRSSVSTLIVCPTR